MHIYKKKAVYELVNSALFHIEVNIAHENAVLNSTYKPAK